MDLHNAILEVLSSSRVPLTSSEIAFRINQSGLYQRKDGKSLKSNQKMNSNLNMTQCHISN